MFRMAPSLRAALVALVALPALAVVGPAPHAHAALDRSAGEARVEGRVEARQDLYVVTGRVVRFGNGRPVRGVRVSLYEGNPRDFLAADTTDANGRFAVRFSAADDGFGVMVQGNRVGYQNGWVGCDLTVKRTFGAACVHGTTVAPIRIKQI